MNKIHLLIFLIAIILHSCSTSSKHENSESKIIGTWQLISLKTIEGGDTSSVDFTNGVKGIKMLNKTDFAFFQHDLNHGKDSSALFVSGSGTYELNGNKYVEHLEYCNFREYEDHTFKFEVTFKGDTLIQQGVEELPDEGINRYIIETYVRIK